MGRECKVAWISLQMTYPLFFSFSCDEFACYFSRYARGMDCMRLLGFGGIEKREGCDWWVGCECSLLVLVIDVLRDYVVWRESS